MKTINIDTMATVAINVGEYKWQCQTNTITFTLNYPC